MAEIITSPNSRNKKSFSKSIKRLSTKIDLTPMVDLGFLLITFFVFTSAMSTPSVMELIETKNGPSKPVKESGTLTIMIGHDHQLYYYHGILKKENIAKQVYTSNFKDIRNIITAKRKLTESGTLMYIIKAGKGSTFGDSINLLDEMSICNISPGHYAEAEPLPIEAAFLK